MAGAEVVVRQVERIQDIQEGDARCGATEADLDGVGARLLQDILGVDGQGDVGGEGRKEMKEGKRRREEEFLDKLATISGHIRNGEWGR